jgi:hypothetical protein
MVSRSGFGGASVVSAAAAVDANAATPKASPQITGWLTRLNNFIILVFSRYCQFESNAPADATCWLYTAIRKIPQFFSQPFFAPPQNATGSHSA